MIRVTTADGNDLYLRRGIRPGEGPIAQFPNKVSAEVNVDMLKPGLTEGDVVTVVPYDRSVE